MKYSVSLLLLFLLSLNLSAQDLYFVYLTDKPEANYADFSEKALERRARHGLRLDELDREVSPLYREILQNEVDSLRYALRWLNAVTVQASPNQIDRLKAFPFVSKIEPFGGGRMEVTSLPNTLKGADLLRQNRLLRLQRGQLGLDTLLSEGLSGKGVRIAIFDAGFKNVPKHPGLAHLFENKQIIAARDFYGGKKNPYRHSGHGTAVLGCIAGKTDSIPIGAAWEAEFLLARTEHRILEPLSEEDHWLAAMEWADENGADIINSSLGYNEKRYVYEQMDGRTTRVTQAARVACRKGILVVNSAGNEGSSDFRYIGAPADADSVLSVGASYPMLPMHMPFSSFGPNARGTMKPNVSAPGYVLSTSRSKKLDEFSGTSFSSPLVAGMAAALLQLHPEYTNMELKKSLEEAGHLYPFFDYAHGFGVPDARNFFRKRDSVSATFDLREEGDSLYFDFHPEFTQVDTNSKSSMDGRVFYFHIEQMPGLLRGYKWELIRPETKCFALPKAILGVGRVRVWFEGYLYAFPNSPDTRP